MNILEKKKGLMPIFKSQKLCLFIGVRSISHITNVWIVLGFQLGLGVN
jgi:hypothetical protein